MSIVSGAVAERMKLFSFFIFAAVIYPLEGSWTWGGADVFVHKINVVSFMFSQMGILLY